MDFKEILEREELARNGGLTAEQLAEKKAADEAKAEEARLAAEQKALDDAAEQERLAKEEANKGKSQEELDAEEAARLEAEKNKPKSLEEILLAGKVEKQEEVIPESVKAKMEQLEREKEEIAGKLASLQSDPLVKAVTAEATKEQLIAIAAELNGKDYSKSSYKELMEAEIRAEGFEGEELAEQLEAELSNFETLLPYQKKKLENELRAKFQATAKKGESPTLANLEAAYTEKYASVKKPADIQKENEAIIAADIQSIKELGAGAIGTEMYGVKFTQEELDDIVKKEYHPEKVLNYLDEKGNLNAGKFIIDQFKLRNFEKMMENAALAAVGKKNVEEKVVRGVPKGTPAKGDVLTAKQADMKAMGYPEYVYMNAK